MGRVTRQEEQLGAAALPVEAQRRHRFTTLATLTQQPGCCPPRTTCGYRIDHPKMV
jgi:hypothetical protein